MIDVHIKMPPRLLDAVRTLATLRGEPYVAVIRGAVRDHVRLERERLHALAIAHGRDDTYCRVCMSDDGTHRDWCYLDEVARALATLES